MLKNIVKFDKEDPDDAPAPSPISQDPPEGDVYDPMTD